MEGPAVPSPVPTPRTRTHNNQHRDPLSRLQWRRMAVKMKRLWARILQLLLAVVVLLYLGDWIALRVRAQTSSTVQVQQFLRTPLKGQKEEFDFMGTVDQPCVRSLFPHNSETPCWWLERHKIRWVSP